MNTVPQLIKNAFEVWAEARTAYAKRYVGHQLGS